MLQCRWLQPDRHVHNPALTTLVSSSRLRSHQSRCCYLSLTALQWTPSSTAPPTSRYFPMFNFTIIHPLLPGLNINPASSLLKTTGRLCHSWANPGLCHTVDELDLATTVVPSMRGQLFQHRVQAAIFQCAQTGREVTSGSYLDLSCTGLECMLFFF